MTKPFSLINELENQDTDPAHLKRNKIVSLLKKKKAHVPDFCGD